MFDLLKSLFQKEKFESLDELYKAYGEVRLPHVNVRLSAITMICNTLDNLSLQKEGSKILSYKIILKICLMVVF